jgi:hypothetical protein
MLSELLCSFLLDFKVEELSGHGNKIMANNQHGISAVIGPQSKTSASYFEGLCELHDIPHIIINRQANHDRSRTINLYPDEDVLSHVWIMIYFKFLWLILIA